MTTKGGISCPKKVQNWRYNYYVVLLCFKGTKSIINGIPYNLEGNDSFNGSVAQTHRIALHSVARVYGVGCGCGWSLSICGRVQVVAVCVQNLVGTFLIIELVRNKNTKFCVTNRIYFFLLANKSLKLIMSIK